MKTAITGRIVHRRTKAAAQTLGELSIYYVAVDSDAEAQVLVRRYIDWKDDELVVQGPLLPSVIAKLKMRRGEVMRADFQVQPRP